MNGEAIREARRAAGWTQAQLAYHLAVSQSVVSEVETGRRSVPLVLEPVLRRWVAGGEPPLRAESERARAEAQAEREALEARRLGSGAAVASLGPDELERRQAVLEGIRESVATFQADYRARWR